MSLIRELWHNIPLPAWGDDSPSDLLALFRRYCEGEAESAGDPLSRMLMHVISIQFTKHADWSDGLVRVGLRSDDIGQGALLHVLRKSGRLWSALRATDQPKLLLAALNTTICRYVLQEIEGRRRKRHKEVTASDCYGDTPGGAGAFGGMAAVGDGAELAEPTANAVLTYLAAKQDDLTDDIPIRGERALNAIVKLYGVLCDGIVRRHEVIPHARLSLELQREVSSELHCLVASRLVRAVSGFDPS